MTVELAILAAHLRDAGLYGFARSVGNAVQTTIPFRVRGVRGTLLVVRHARIGEAPPGHLVADVYDPAREGWRVVATSAGAHRSPSDMGEGRMGRRSVRVPDDLYRWACAEGEWSQVVRDALERLRAERQRD